MGDSVIRFLFSSRRLQTRCALVTGVQTCALPIWDRLYPGRACAEIARRPQGDARPDGRRADLARPRRLRPGLRRPALEARGAEISAGPARRPDSEGRG